MRIAYQIIGAAALLAALVPLASCSREPAPSGDESLTVAATIFPLFDIVRRVADDELRVELVLPPGASPHVFDPTPGDVRRLQAASVIFRIGHGLDDWAERLLAPGRARAVIVDRGIALRRGAHHDHGETSGLGDLRSHGGEEAGAAATAGDSDRGGHEEPVDPHYWLRADNAAAIAVTVGEELAGLDPEHAEGYRQRAAALGEELASLHRELAAAAGGLGDRRLVTFHDAWSYFAAAYGFTIAAVFEPFAGRSPSPAWIAEFQRKVREAGIDVVFLEPQLSSDALVTVASDLGVGLGTLDPNGGVNGRAGYAELLRWNLEQIRAARAGDAAASER